MKQNKRWACLIVALAAHSASGTWFYWQGAGGSGVGDYEVPANWTTSIVPGNADDAAFKNTANKNWRVTLNSNVTHSVILNDISGAGSETVFNLNQKTLTSTEANSGIYFRYGAGGKVTFTNGTLACYRIRCHVEPASGSTTLTNHAFIAFQNVFSEGSIADFAGSTATFEGGAHSVTNLMRIGNMTLASAYATVKLVGGTRFGVTNEVDVGGISGSTGRLEVADATFRMGSAGNYVGHFANSEGTLTVGTGAEVFVPGYLWFGHSGHGVFEQSGGNCVVTNGITLGEYAAARGEMTLSGGSFSGTAALNLVGKQGRGDVTLTGGTNFLNGILSLGCLAGGTGYMTVLGGTNTFGSDVVVDRIYVGDAGTGTLLAGGGTNTTVASSIGTSPGGSGTMTVTNGLWRNTKHMWVGYYGNGNFNVSGGEMRFVDGGPVLAVGRYVNATGMVAVSGGVLDVNGSVWMGGAASAFARLSLSGSGVLRTKTIQEYNAAATSLIVFDGGTLKAAASGALIQPLDDVRLSATGMVVDTDGYAVSIVPTLQDATAGVAGGITKKGAGTLTLAGTRAATGPVSVLGGTLVVSNNVAVLAGTSRIDGVLSLTAANRLTVGAGAALAGTGTVARVTLADNAVFARSKTDVAVAPLNVSDCVANGHLTVDLSGYSLTDLLISLPLLKVPSTAFAKPMSVNVKRNGVSAPSVIVRYTESDGATVLNVVYNSGTMIRVY